MSSLNSLNSFYEVYDCPFKILCSWAQLGNSRWQIFPQDWQTLERRYWLDLSCCLYFCDEIWACGLLLF